MKKLSDWHFFLKIFFTSLIGISITGILGAQVPTITSFAPTSGPISSNVTITGTNFSTTPANNIVWFGAVQATVTAATATQLTVKVPVGATYQPISVTTSGNTAYTKVPFSVTFPSSQVVDATAFSAKVDFTGGTGPYSIAIGDIDGDGKPDLVVTNDGSSTVSVFRNISTSGSIAAGSFAPKVDFTTGTSPSIVIISDIDGDGKPDLVITNWGSSTVSVFRNTSTSGSITTGSFATRVDFTTGTNPEGAAVGDIDGDGKPDMVIANSNSNNVSVFRNTSTSGSITTSSFAAKVDFTTGTLPQIVAIADIDGDNKPDLAVTNYSSNTVSVFRNTSTSGSITTGSFVAKVDFTTGTGPYGLAIGDIDGDGKADMVTANYDNNTVSAFRNASTSGSITFVTKVDFAAGTGPEVIVICDIDGDGKPDVAVTNYDANTISVGKNSSTPGSITASSFATGADFTAGTGPFSIAIGDLDGDGKPDLAVANYSSSTVSVFRNTILAPPVISSFTPTSGPIGTTVTITGNNFSTTAANNIVWFGAVKATVTAAIATQLTVTVPTGATYQPINVTNVTTGLTTYSNTPFNVTFLSTQVIDATAFASKVDFTTGTGTNPWGIAIGDIDGDGKPDLAVSNYGVNTISVFRNTSTSGSITAGSFAARVDLTTGTNPQGVAIGDIDGDGKPDLVVASHGSSMVSVFRNISTSGSITAGSFAARVDFTTGTGPLGIAIGDIDGDGKPDLAVTNDGSSTVSVFRNTSTSGSITTGSFAARVDFTTGTGPIGVAIGDIDGDGKPDLAVSNYTSSTVSVFRNTSTSGSITISSFATKVDFASGTTPYIFAIGDIDGDGKLDLTVPNYGSNTVSVFRNTSTSGTIGAGSFATKVDFTTGSGPYCVALGDIDGDGKPDLAVANYTTGSVSVFRNVSTSGSIIAGSFAAKVDFIPGVGPRGVALGDIDGDGKPDLAVANWGSSTVSVLRNTISTPVVPTISSFTPTSGPIGTTVTITGTNFSTTAANNIVWFGAVKATVTSATATQLTVTVPTGATYQPINVTNVTTGLTAYSSAPFAVTYPSTHIIDATAFASKVDFTTGTSPISVVIGDIDGDGKSDLAVTNTTSNTVSVFRNTSTSGSIAAGSFAANVDFTAGTTQRYFAIGDIDGDGKPDLAVANLNSNTVSVFRNTSTSGAITTGSFSAKVDFATGTNPYGVAICDIDGDGKPDLVVTNTASNSVSVFRNTSTIGSITTGSFAVKVDFTTGTGPLFIAIGDIDGDGKPDLAVANQTSNTVSVFRNTSNSGSITLGSFAAKVDFITGTSPSCVAIGDIDGDGKPDLAVANYGTGINTVSVFRNTSTSGSITTGSFAAKADFTTGTNPYYVAIGDIDGDGKPDLIVANVNSNTVSVFRNTSTSGSIGIGSFATKVDFTTGTSPEYVAIGDVDGDGKPDLAIANTGSNTVSVLRNTLLAATPPVITSFTPTSGPIGTAVTITGTNFSTTAANNIVWFGAVKATVTAATSTTLSITVPTGTTYQPITVTNVTTGLTAYSSSLFTVTFSTTQIIDATAFASKVDFTTGTGTNPYSVAIGDIDGDGKPDLVVSNNTSNTVSVFRNTSTSGSISTGSFATKVDFTTGLNPLSIAIGDIDGDGKQDLVVTNVSSSTVSVFRNTSTSGSITTGSFASKVDFTTGTGPYFVAIGDIDGDGKPDLAIANGTSNSVSVLRNTCSSGSITTSSFATRVDFTTGTGPHGVTIGDIDGDGKPDLAVTNYTSSTVSVFRNTSTSGSIVAGSFATKVDFTPGTNPYFVVICDIDGDGKPDLAVSNYASNSFSVFRNTSTSGSIGTGSFSAKVDFATGTTPLNITLGDIDGDGKPDLAVANQNSNTISVFRNTSTSGSIAASSLAAKIDFTTGTAPYCVAIGDIDGDGKPDLVVTNNTSNTISVLRNTMPVFVPPTAPTVGTITQPTCALATGSVVLNDLPATGTWTLTQSPGGTTTTGTGISTTISALASGTYTYTVTSSVSGLTSVASANVVINAQPATPTAPTVGTITQPTCLAVSSVILNGLPATGTWTLTRSPGGTTTTGTGTSSTISGLTTGTYTYTVTSASGCTSVASANVVINALSTQTAPTVGTITQPSCPVPTGSVILSGLPSSGTWTLTRTPGGTITTGTGTSSTISGLASGTYTYTVTNVSGCTSVASGNVVINALKTGVIPKIKSKWNDILICYNLGDSIRSYKWYKGSTLISGTDTTKQFWATGKQIGVYLVSTTDKTGCKNSSNSISISGTKSFSVYPNPAKENFAVTLNDETLGKTVITIINGMGTKVMEVETEKEFDDLYEVIPVTNLDEGVYYVKVSVNQVNVYYTKIVVLK